MRFRDRIRFPVALAVSLLVGASAVCPADCLIPAAVETNTVSPCHGDELPSVPGDRGADPRCCLVALAPAGVPSAEPIAILGSFFVPSALRGSGPAVPGLILRGAPTGAPPPLYLALRSLRI